MVIKNTGGAVDDHNALMYDYGNKSQIGLEVSQGTNRWPI